MVNGVTTDSVRVYLKEIGRIKMLSGDQEISLARQIQDLLSLEADPQSGSSLRRARTEAQSRNDRETTQAEWAEFIGIELK